MRNNNIFRISLAIVLVVIAMAIGSQTAEAAKSTYWVTGGSGNSSLKFNGKKFKFSGKWGKGSSLEKSADKYYKKAAKFKKSIKKGKYKTGSIGSDGLVYDKESRIDKDTELVGITVHVKIKKGKVVEIIFSAM